MTTQATISAPRLAAFGAPVWAYKPVSILGVEVAFAVLLAAFGAAVLALPVVVALMVGGDLNDAQSYSNSFVPSSYTPVDPGPPALIEASNVR